MRIAPQEVGHFVSVLSQYLNPGEGRLYLYGSRTDNSLKGGDIDLLLVSHRSHELAKSRAEIQVKFKKLLGERRIDFSVISEAELSGDPFYSGLKLVLLKEW